MNRFLQFTQVTLLSFVLFGCTAKQRTPPPRSLRTITFIDRNGITETISDEKRIHQYESVDFLSQQPYRKVLRIYHRTANGDLGASVTTYHPNGEPKQLLEILNSRAFGPYREWYPSGLIKIEAFVIGGEPDIDPTSEQTWLFDGEAMAWSEDGSLEAALHYSKGALDGPSLYYHKNGSVWKEFFFKEGKLDGKSAIYLDDGTLLQSLNYKEGKQEGEAYRYWEFGALAADEIYLDGKLLFGKYYYPDGTLVSKVEQGSGMRTRFGKEHVQEIRQVLDGKEDGLVKTFTPEGLLFRTYYTKNGLKQGAETLFFTQPHLLGQPQLKLNWYEGVIQGVASTWYENGTRQSEREMSQNKKNGLSTAWYKDGSLLLLEEYEDDTLLRGEYYRKGEQIPVSQVVDGTGTATLFDGEGNFTKKVVYENGHPKQQ